VAQVWRVYGDVLVGFGIALPAAALAAWALTRWRRRHGVSPWLALRRSLAEVGAVVGTVPWLVMTMRPDPAGESRLSLVPIRDLLSLDPSAVPVQVVGNLLVFAAFGFCAPVRFAALASLARIGVLAAGCSLAIEVLQFALDLGRVSAVDDVLVNAAGAVLAAVLSRRWWAGARPRAAV
jgi:hypothetical protein